eukprot:TRINITY_DN18402_c0_g1_i1.p1 TRINITY_DN18402_c0_g1~~TRINITY_DN18402_c0_g1_i1.p1  ORF type:complete len:470 (-),score=82.70 TRINITY_DN18402_c0_g1_i1:137-1441(-)
MPAEPSLVCDNELARLYKGAVCPTPHGLATICVRGERELPRWRSAGCSNELLGNHAQMMADLARYLFDAVGRRKTNSHGGTLRFLSAADGCSDDTQLDWQARVVPTSVMLAHAYASSAGDWWPQLDDPQSTPKNRIRVFGADVRNAVQQWYLPQQFPWQLPPWLDHRFIALDNTREFGPQLNSQCESPFFDIVLVRQGMCFCDDPSKVSTSWPREVSVSIARDCVFCGIYQLEMYLYEGRPAYRNGNCLLQWNQSRLEWAVMDVVGGGTWAFARGDVGHPVLARGPWAVWDGTSHVNDRSFVCDLAPPGMLPPWHRRPPERLCCCGVPGDALSVLYLLQRIAAVLDVHQLHSFGFLHSSWTNGTRVEVDELHQQIAEAAWLFNERRSGVHVAAALRRTSAPEYWLQCDGIVLFQPGSRADPYCANGYAQYDPSV